MPVKKLSKKNGFTLIELLVVVSIFSLVAIITMDYIIKGLRYSQFAEAESNATVKARQAIASTTKDIRGARRPLIDTVPFVISSQNFTYYYDTDANPYDLEQVHYYLNGTSLIRDYIDGGSVATSTIIATNIMNGTTNEQIFNFYDSASPTPLLIPLSGINTRLTDISFVEIKLRIKNFSGMATSTLFKGSVNLRNF
jgi:prepilin-type N-terminal cleavage/methylation domain-containing protein